MIRTAKIQDAQTIARIHVQTWRCAYDGIVPRAHLDGMSEEARTVRWRDILSQSPSGTLVAENGGQVVGWVSFGKCRDEGSDGAGEIYAIYVHPTYWSKGFGHQLMHEAEHVLSRERCGRITVWVFELNHRSRMFYENCGYSADGTRKQVLIGGAELLELRYAKTSEQGVAPTAAGASFGER